MLTEGCLPSLLRALCGALCADPLKSATAVMMLVSNMTRGSNILASVERNRDWDWEGNEEGKEECKIECAKFGRFERNFFFPDIRDAGANTLAGSAELPSL